jgi:hypothetical protein
LETHNPTGGQAMKVARLLNSPYLVLSKENNNSKVLP